MTTPASLFDQPEQLEQPSILSQVSMETMVSLLLFLAGACARFFWLDFSPLSSNEARQAIASWNFVRGMPDAFTGSPLLFFTNTILFTLFGATDFAARFIPALAGSLLVLTPALFRKEIGRVGALFASAFFAFSPSLVFFSRNANGTVIAVTCAFAALAFAWRFLNDESPRDLNISVVLAALALVSAREAWTIALAMFLAVLAIRARNEIAIPSTAWRFAALLGAMVFFGVTTAFMLHREGVGATFDLFGAWLNGLRPGIDLSDPLRLLALYEPIILILGLAAMVRVALSLAQKNDVDPPQIALTLWASIALILYSVGADKSPARVVVIVVPLALLAAQCLGAWLERIASETDRGTFLAQDLPVILLACAIVSFLFLIFAEYATRGNIAAAQVIAAALKQPENSALVIFLLTMFAIAVMLFLTITTVGLTRAPDVGLTIILVLLTLWTIRQSAMVNLGALNPRELLVARAPSLNVRDLENDLPDVSRWRANDSHALSIAVDESLSPIIAWILRDFRNARFVARPSPDDANAILAPAITAAPANGWISQTFRLEETRSETNLNLLRWLIFRDVGSVESTSVKLWIPAPR